MLKDNLSKARDSAHLTQQDIAEHLNIKRQTYSAYERGVSIPDALTLNSLADLFDCTTDYLLGRTDEPNLVHYDTGVDYEGDRVYIDIVKEYLDKGLTKEDIDEFIQMGLAWREARENIKKKPKKD